MSRKKQRRERLPTFSSKDESEVPKNHIDKLPILIGKTIDFANFTLQTLVFHVEELFISMGWVSTASVDPKLMRDFYENMVYTPRKGSIS